MPAPDDEAAADAPDDEATPPRRKKWMPGMDEPHEPGSSPPTSVTGEPTGASSDASDASGADGEAPGVSGREPGDGHGASEASDIPAASARGEDGADESTDSALQRLGFGFDKEAVRGVIERHFKVYDQRDALPGLGESVLVAYFILGSPEEVRAQYPMLISELRAIDKRLVPMLRRDGGETVVVVTRRGHEQKPKRALPLFLAVATVITAILSGGLAWVAYEGSVEVMRMFEPRLLMLGALTFALPLLFIILAQDLVRRIVARRHHVRLALPYLIPVPPLLFFPSVGTFGSMTNPQDPVPDRRALFDIGASGPLAGVFAAIPVLFVGFLLTSAHAVSIPDGNDLTVDIGAPDGMTWIGDAGDVNETRRGGVVDGYGGPVSSRWDIANASAHGTDASWSFTIRSIGESGDAIDAVLAVHVFDNVSARVANETWNASVKAGNSTTFNVTIPAGTERILAVLTFNLPDATTIRLGEPGVFSVMYDVLGREADHVIHPTALAGWVGLLFVGVSLLPVGRFDGGLIARAALGENMRYASWAAMILLVVLSCAFPLWIHVALFILLFVGIRNGPPLDDTTPLDTRRQVWSIAMVLVFLATFVWVPARIPGLDVCLHFFGL